ncbi:unnamed protein product [Paramecium octaurelia]|uniref:Potassium channel domain-containing protein n=1 Tax=Paramecium octaurelia TaxID=43137 RepID=A0A8S1WX39_PAROT|nr:unnamed protein product [Paramecium octaurelia]
MVITPQAGLFDSNLVQGLAIEILLILPTPTPFTQMIRVDFNQRYTGELRFYYLNEILTYILTFRVILLINITLKFSSFYSSQIGRLCRLYSTDFDTHLVFKLCMKDLPGYTLMGLFITGMLLFGYSMEIAERSLQRNEVQQHSVYSVMTSMWVTLTTIATVGYGEFYPTTDLGRISMAICVFWGVSYTSLFTAMLDSMFERMNCEEMVWALLEKTSVTNVMKQFSQDLIVRIQKMKIKKLQHNNIHLIQDSINALKQMKRQYRNIDGEDSMSKAKRKFKDINFMFQDWVCFFELVLTFGFGQQSLGFEGGGSRLSYFFHGGLQILIMSQDVEITKQKTPSLSKKWRVKRQGSILSDSQSTFEDSRITLLLFEQYRIVEMTRFCVIFGTQIIAIMEV